MDVEDALDARDSFSSLLLMNGIAYSLRKCHLAFNPLGEVIRHEEVIIHFKSPWHRRVIYSS